MATLSHLFHLTVSSGLILVLGTQIAYTAEPPAKNKETAPPNRLSKESSPYLLQHAHNPVDWFPWGPEAFEKAKKEKKLIFLSVGYSSCHWCHVMEKESFSNKEVAELLNKNFVCIKVDREERPDVDEIYMAALSVIGARGGWPMSMFLTADGKPIVGGTYWPREDREIEGRKVNGFKTILNTILAVHKEKPKELEEQANAIAEETAEQLARTTRIVPVIDLDRALANGAAESLREDLDPVYGGIGNKGRKFIGTKFPMPTPIALLLDHAQREKDKDLMAQVTLTLDRMARGGIYDQLGGGFHRYSTERTWTIPHFEKMLYDNAQLVELYSRAYKIDPRPQYRRIIRETLGFIQREMTSPDGGFYSALDADSNGTEGEFYVWTISEIEKVLGDKADVAIFRAAYGMTDKPNFEEKFYILKLPRPLKDVAKEQKLSEEDLDKKLAILKKKLFDVRAKRERPFLDTKILTAWNGQMIAAYALAGQILKEPEYVKTAANAANFLLKNLRNADGRLLRSYSTKSDGKSEAKLNAYLDDYVFLVHGLLILADASADKRWLDEAKGLTDQMVKWHGDGDKGGFYFTSSDHEKLFVRPKDSFDGAQPSANGMAIRNLIQLSVVLKDENYRKRAEQSIRQFAAIVRSNPSAVPGMCYDLHLYLDAFSAKATGKEAKKLPAPEEMPLKSEDVVKLDVKAEKPTDDGKQSITIKLNVTEAWHIYANSSSNGNPAISETTVTIRSKGKEIPAEIVYPKGKLIKDKIVGDYGVYEGEVVIKATLKREKGEDAPVEVSVKVQACMGYDAEGKCLAPATLKTTVK